jgi:hypothetical protein
MSGEPIDVFPGQRALIDAGSIPWSSLADVEKLRFHPGDYMPAARRATPIERRQARHRKTRDVSIFRTYRATIGGGYGHERGSPNPDFICSLLDQPGRQRKKLGALHE